MPSWSQVGDVESYSRESGCIDNLDYAIDGLSTVAAHLDVSSSSCSSPVRAVDSIIFFQDCYAFVHLLLVGEYIGIIV